MHDTIKKNYNYTYIWIQITLYLSLLFFIFFLISFGYTHEFINSFRTKI